MQQGTKTWQFNTSILFCDIGIIFRMSYITIEFLFYRPDYAGGGGGIEQFQLLMLKQDEDCLWYGEIESSILIVH